MPPRFLQTPARHMESSPECPATHITELHIQIKLENETIPRFSMNISRALLKELNFNTRNVLKFSTFPFTHRSYDFIQ